MKTGAGRQDVYNTMTGDVVSDLRPQELRAVKPTKEEIEPANLVADYRELAAAPNLSAIALALRE